MIENVRIDNKDGAVRTSLNSRRPRSEPPRILDHEYAFGPAEIGTRSVAERFLGGAIID